MSEDRIPWFAAEEAGQARRHTYVVGMLEQAISNACTELLLDWTDRTQTVAYLLDALERAKTIIAEGIPE